MKIDSHQHFWRFNEKDFGWINDRMKVIRTHFLPEDLEKEMQQAGYDGSIAVQARQSLDETSWLLSLASSHSYILGVVGWVDLCSKHLEQQLEQFSLDPKLVGVRHVLHDEPEIDFMLRPDFLKGISLLAPHKLTYDILIFPEHLPNTLQLVKHFPDQVFIVDHVAKPDIKNQILSPWKEDMQRLAQNPNVFCKLSGMVTEANLDLWKKEDFTPYLDIVFGCFGTNRVMIGSDWPVCKVAGSYSKVMGIVENYVQSFTETEKAAVLGENARRIYNLL